MLLLIGHERSFYFMLIMGNSVQFGLQAAVHSVKYNNNNNNKVKYFIL